MDKRPDEIQAVSLPTFRKAWKRLGLSDEDREAMEEELLSNPTAGKIMRETGGARKLRYALGNRGKSAGARIIYAYFQEWGRLYFLTVFSKHDKPNLTGQERVELEKLVKRLEEALRLQ